MGISIGSYTGILVALTVASALAIATAPAMAQAEAFAETETTTVAQSEGPYPIWWSDRLGLASLEDIDAELDKPFAEGMTFWVFNLMKVSSEAIHAPNLSQRIEERAPELAPGFREITSCRSLIRDMVRGFHPASTGDHGSYRLVSPRCYALQALKHARPARESFVTGFVLDENIRNNLTPMASRSWICLEILQILEANAKGIAWQDHKFEPFSDDLHVEEVLPADGDGIVIKRWWPEVEDWFQDEGSEPREEIIAYGDRNFDGVEEEVILSVPVKRRITNFALFHYRIDARADFNGDGLEDLMLLREERYIDNQRTRVDYQRIVVSRARAEDILRVVQILGPEDAGNRDCELEALSLPLPQEAP